MNVRRQEYTRIANDLRYLQTTIKKSEDVILRLRHLPESVFNQTQIAKNKEKNEERQKEKEALEQRLSDLEQGLLDQELQKEVKRETEEAAVKTRLTRQRKQAAEVIKQAQSVTSKAFYQAGRDSDRKHRYQERSIKRSFQHFVRACNSVPDYMSRNLAEMPSNKGYYWKSVACYGELPSEPGQPTILFDRKRGGVMIIHEFTNKEYRTYEKNGKDRKRLISCTPRRIRELPPFCANVQEQKTENISSQEPRHSRAKRENSGRTPRSENKSGRYDKTSTKWRPRGPKKEGSDSRARPPRTGFRRGNS